MTRIAVDAMGGDYAPGEIVKGAVWAAHDYNIPIELVGKIDEIQKVLEIPDFSVTKTQALREINLGEGNGKSRDWYNEHVATPPAIYNPDFRSFPDAESDRELWNRLHSFYEQLISSNDEKIIIVSHGGALSFLISMLMGDNFEDRQKRNVFGRSGSVSRFAIKKDGTVEISYLNCQVIKSIIQ